MRGSGISNHKSFIKNEHHQGYHGFTSDQIRELRQIFNLFEKNGKIQMKQIEEIMLSLGFQHTNPTLYSAFSKPLWQSNSLDFQGFIFCVSGRLQFLQTREQIMTLFHILDQDNSFKLNYQDIRDLAKETGYNLSELEFKEILGYYTYGQQSINRQDFYAAITHKIYH